MNSLVSYIKMLYEHKLYSNVTKVCNLAMIDECQTISDLDKLQTTVIYAESLFYIDDYIHAEKHYQEALHLLKYAVKNKNIEATDFNENEIKYKMYECYMKMKKIDSALTILLSITSRNRSPKINQALGNLYRETGKDRAAIACYKEVLKICPLALESAENLFQMGLKGIEVNSLLLDATSQIPWLNLWIKAMGQINCREFGHAFQTMKTLDTTSFLKDNCNLIVQMAYCLHYMGEIDKAIALLQRALRLDPNLTFGRDLLSTLLVLAATDSNDYALYLEKICPTGDTLLWSSHDWVVLGNYMFLKKSYDKAAYLSQQALEVAKNNIEALLLKVKTEFELGKYMEASINCRQGLRLCPYRYEFYACAVDCLLKMNRLREAAIMASNACKELKNSPEAQTLHVSVLLKDPATSSKAVKKFLEGIAAQDKPMTTKTVCMLVQLFDREQQYEQSKELLLKAIELSPTAQLHQLLGDCYVNLEKNDEAFEHYNTALRLDPDNAIALQNLNAIGHPAGNKRETAASDLLVCNESNSDEWTVFD